MQPDDSNQQKQFETIVNLMYDKKPGIMEEVINQIRKVDPVSYGQLCEKLFPDILAAREEAGRIAGEKSMLDIVLQNIRKTALRYHTSYEDVLDDSDLPEWCSREEALKRLNDMPSTE